MNDKSPSTQEWKDLYDAAIKFKEVECWNWMYDSDLFGVQDPATNEIGYCCIMGNAGEHFALAVYQGSEGLEGHKKMQSGEVSPFSIDILHLQKCLMASFEDRDFLQKEDLQIIKRLGLKFRGPHSWPFFRSYLPEYHPWHLTSEEAKYLTLSLLQAIEVSLRFKDDQDLLTSPKENHYLVRVQDKSGRWKDEWLKPLPVEKRRVVVKPMDTKRLEGVKGMMTQRQGVWEIDFVYFPQPVKEKKERPFYPLIIIWADHGSGLILNFHMQKYKECISGFPEEFLKLAEDIRSLPEEILVKKEEVFQLVQPVASDLEIKLRRVERLEALEAAHTDMLEFFKR
jgi:hypothetical protein